MDRDQAAEQAYLKANAHWQICPTCTEVMGETASNEEMCPIGRTLTEQWEGAEQAYWEEENYGTRDQKSTG